MRDDQLQTPQKDHSLTNRRSKFASDRNKKLPKLSKKNLNSALSSFTEDVVVGFESPKESIDSSSIMENWEENLLAESSEDLSVSLTPASAISSEAVASSEITTLSSIIYSNEPKDGIASRTAKQENMISSSVEVEVVIKSLREAQLNVVKSKDMDLRSKRLLDAMVNFVAEEFLQLPVEKDCFNELMSKKCYVVVVCFLLWSLTVFAVLFISSHRRTSSMGLIPT